MSPVRRVFCFLHRSYTLFSSQALLLLFVFDLLRLELMIFHHHHLSLQMAVAIGEKERVGIQHTSTAMLKKSFDKILIFAIHLLRGLFFFNHFC
jgi:hypothetical protein